MLCNFKVEKPSKTLKLKERILLTLKLKECGVFLFLWAPTLIFPKSICFWMVYICSVLSIRLAPSLQAVTSCRNGNHNSDITAQLHTLPRVNVPPPAVFVSAPWWVNTKVLRVRRKSSRLPCLFAPWNKCEVRLSAATQFAPFCRWMENWPWVDSC